MPSPTPDFPFDFTATIENFLAGDAQIERADVEAILRSPDAPNDVKTQAREALAWTDTTDQLRSTLTPPAGARERLLAQVRAATPPAETNAPAAPSFFPVSDPFADTLEAFLDGRLNRDEVDAMINNPSTEHSFRRELAETLTLTDALRRAHAQLEPQPGARQRLLDAIAQLAADEQQASLDDEDDDAPLPIPFPSAQAFTDTPDLLAAGYEPDDDEEEDQPDPNKPEDA